MNTVGVIVCNYNKKDYAVNCVKSILGQTFAKRDVYLVDNASTDGSVVALKEQYGEQITILQNAENEGGAGGFDRGIEHCMAAGYEFLLLVDNDTVFAPNALEMMYQYMQTHENVGMCGACILQMENPEYIQEIGGMIDYNRHEISPNYRNQKITDKIPAEVKCDFLAACALLVRKETVEKIGIMRRDYFVYWDDIEWSRRCIDAGYSLTALRDVHVWHNWSANTVTKFNAFTEYYGRRNKLRFFAAYIEEKDIDLFIDNALRNMFNVIYGHYRKGAYEEMQLTLRALDDVIHNIWGKAEQSKIKIDKITELPLEKLLKSSKEVIIVPNEAMGEDGGVTAIERIVHFCNPDIKLLAYSEGNLQDRFVLKIKPCPHVIRTTENILPVVWVDRFLNCILTEEDFAYFQNYENVYGLFYRLYEPFLREGVEKIRKGEKIRGEDK